MSRTIPSIGTLQVTREPFGQDVRTERGVPHRGVRARARGHPPRTRASRAASCAARRARSRGTAGSGRASRALCGTAFADAPGAVRDRKCAPFCVFGIILVELAARKPGASNAPRFASASHRHVAMPLTRRRGAREVRPDLHAPSERTRAKRILGTPSDAFQVVVRRRFSGSRERAREEQFCPVFRLTDARRPPDSLLTPFRPGPQARALEACSGILRPPGVVRLTRTRGFPSTTTTTTTTTTTAAPPATTTHRAPVQAPPRAAARGSLRATSRFAGAIRASARDRREGEAGHPPGAHRRSHRRDARARLRETSARHPFRGQGELHAGRRGVAGHAVRRDGAPECVPRVLPRHRAVHLLPPRVPVLRHQVPLLPHRLLLLRQRRALLANPVPTAKRASATTFAYANGPILWAIRCGATRWCSTRTTKCKACTSTACPRSSPGARAGTDRAISASPAGVSRFLDPATTTPDVAPRRARRRRSSFFPRRPRLRRLSRTSSSFPRSGIWRGNARICSKPSWT